MTKKPFFILTLGTLLITFNAFATTFKAMPLEKLIEESSSAAEVELKSKKSFMTKLGIIMTEFTFSVLESHNLDNSDLDGEFLKLTMTGGSYDGVTSYIDSAPEFEVGEKSFLLLKKIESKNYLSNFTMGKYKIQQHDGQTYYVSSVFPFDAELGRVKKEKMIELVKSKFKITEAPMKKVNAKEKIAFARSRVLMDERTPAAQDELEERSAPDGAVAMWSFFSLFMISGCTIWWKLKKGMSV